MAPGPVDQALAQVAVHDPFHEQPVLADQRPVEPPLAAQQRDRVGSRVDAENGQGRVTGDQVDHEKDDDRDADGYWHELQ